MKTIFSKSDPKLLLQIIHRKPTDVKRIDIVPEQNFLQVASLNLLSNQKFAAHKHLWKQLAENRIIPQESWVIIEGKVRVDCFDIDDKFLESNELNPGDISITLFGGHSYTVLENTIAYEFKVGPYLGQFQDKIFLKDEL